MKKDAYFRCPGVVIGGSVQRCKASRDGQFASEAGRILARAAISEGIESDEDYREGVGQGTVKVKHSAEAEAEAVDVVVYTSEWGSGTAQWGGVADTVALDSPENLSTPAHYVDVHFNYYGELTETSELLGDPRPAKFKYSSRTAGDVILEQTPDNCQVSLIGGAEENNFEIEGAAYDYQTAPVPQKSVTDQQVLFDRDSMKGGLVSNVMMSVKPSNILPSGGS